MAILLLCCAIDVKEAMLPATFSVRINEYIERHQTCVFALILARSHSYHRGFSQCQVDPGGLRVSQGISPSNLQEETAAQSVSLTDASDSPFRRRGLESNR